MSNVQHLRTQPAEWSGLVEHANRLVPPNLSIGEPFRREHVEPLFDEIVAMPDGSREANCYYGLGEVMCRMAGLLGERKAARQRLILDAAKGMLHDALERREADIPFDQPFTPVVGDLVPDAMARPFLVLAIDAQSLMPASHRALTDTLSAATMHRRMEVYEGYGPYPEVARATAIQDACENYLTARFIAGNSLTGATAVLATLLTGWNPANEPSEEILATPIDISVVRASWDPRTYGGSAALRLDEFSSGAGWHGSGKSLRFDPGILATPPPPLETVAEPGHLHQNRLICPALQAGRLALHVAHYELPEIIETAQQLIPAQHFRRDADS